MPKKIIITFPTDLPLFFSIITTATVSYNLHKYLYTNNTLLFLLISIFMLVIYQGQPSGYAQCTPGTCLKSSEWITWLAPRGQRFQASTGFGWNGAVFPCFPWGFLGYPNPGVGFSGIFMDWEALYLETLYHVFEGALVFEGFETFSFQTFLWFECVDA